MIANRLARDLTGPAADAPVDAPADVACLACGFVSSAAARFCRRCGERRPMARPLTAVAAGPDIDVPAQLTDRDPAERPPLVALWGPLDDLRYGRGAPAAPTRDAAPIGAVPPDLPTPLTFGSFGAGSAWSPRAVGSDTEALSAPSVRAMAGRCNHRQAPRAAATICAICGGIPGPRVVTARASGIGNVPAGMTAEQTLSAGQRRAFLIGGIAVAIAFIIAPLSTLIGLIALATALYAAIALQRVRIFALAMERPDVISVSDADARAISPSKLPIYTVLIPAYREPEVVGRLLASIHALDYPLHKLDVKLLLEQDDPETLEAALAARPGPHVEIVRVPPVGPRTKPKALVVGLARARGQYVTVYDAEDQPEPLQLRRAIVAFRRNRGIACLQAKLSYRNAGQNLITRWFTAEYAMWFGQFLPGLSRMGVPLPLGGTSNHFRRRALRESGSWDPFNVTEDADLGIRLSRTGRRVAVLDSTTYEEANSDFVNWAKQRSRWYKGYLQTWLIHMREPRRLWHELGPRGFIGFNLFVGGTPVVAILNPLFWAMTALWFLARPAIIVALFPAWLYYAGLACLVGGNLVFLYGSMISARATGRPDVVLAALLAPVYWVMMSIAAVKAAVQLVHAPSFWEKTTHGLDLTAMAADASHGPSS